MTLDAERTRAAAAWYTAPVLRCTKCGKETKAKCRCGVAYEVVAKRKEQDRQRAKAYRARKDEQKQQAHHVTPMQNTHGSRYASWKEEPVIDVPAVDIDVMADPYDPDNDDKRAVQYAAHMVDYILRGIVREQYDRRLVLKRIIRLLTEELDLLPEGEPH